MSCMLKQCMGKGVVDLPGQKGNATGSILDGSRWRVARLRKRLMLTAWKASIYKGSDNNIVVSILLELKLLLEELSCSAKKMLLQEKSVLLWCCCYDEEIMAWKRGCWSYRGDGAGVVVEKKIEVGAGFWFLATNFLNRCFCMGF